MDEPYFSVVIPTFNRSAFILTAIRSVLAQTFSAFEAVVVDDGSTDNTEAVIRTIMDSRVRYFRKDNAERGAARNFGVNVSRGRYVNFLDSDDVLHPHHLQTAYDFVRRNEVDVFHLGYDIRRTDGTVVRSVGGMDSINERILSGNVLSCNGVVARREVLMQNPFNETRALSSLEDWELWIRLGAKYKIHNVNAVTSSVVDHEQRSVLTGQESAIEGKVSLLIKLVIENPNNLACYGTKLNRVVANAHSYAALHLRMVNAPRAVSLNHLWRGIKASPGILFSKRTFVIILMLAGLR